MHVLSGTLVLVNVSIAFAAVGSIYLEPGAKLELTNVDFASDPYAVIYSPNYEQVKMNKHCPCFSHVNKCLFVTADICNIDLYFTNLVAVTS